MEEEIFVLFSVYKDSLTFESNKGTKVTLSPVYRTKVVVGEQYTEQELNDIAEHGLNFDISEV